MTEVLKTSDCAQVGLTDTHHSPENRMESENRMENRMEDRMESDKTSTACGAVDDWLT